MQPIAAPPRPGVAGFCPNVEANAIAAHGSWNPTGKAPPFGGGGMPAGGGAPGGGMAGDGQGGGVVGGQDSGPPTGRSGIPSGWGHGVNDMSSAAQNAHRGTAPPASCLGMPDTCSAPA